MQKKYIVALMSITLCLVFLCIFYVSQDIEEVRLESIDSNIENEVIDFISSWGAYDSKSARIKLIFKELNKIYPEIEIHDYSMSGEDFLFMLKMHFASGNEPSIFGLWPGSDFRLLVKQNKIADLTGVLQEDPEWYAQFNPNTWDYVTVDNKIYGLPVEMIYEGLFINKDLFDAYNVKIPTNFEELMEAVDTFSTHGIIPIAYNQSPEGSYIYQNIVMKLGGKEDVENPFDTEGKIKHCFIEGMFIMKELYEAGAFPKSLFALDDKERNELFLNKEAAMIVQGSWFIGDNALSSYDHSVDIIPFPTLPGGKAQKSDIIYGCGNGIFHMSQKAWDNPVEREMCLKILKELTSPKTASILAQESGFISNIYFNENNSHTAIMIQKGEALVQQATQLVGPVDSFIDRPTWENIIIRQFPDMLQGKITPEEIFAQVYMTMNE